MRALILRAGVIHETFCESHGLIAKSLQPENACVGDIDQYSLVELIEDDVRRPSRRGAHANQRLEVTSRTRLVYQNVQRKTDELTARRNIGPIGAFGCDGAELLGETQRIATVARGEAMDVESVNRSQPAPSVVHDLGKLESLRQSGVHFLAAAVGLQVGGEAK